ncbi:hypothetical protein NLU13_6747 [Sarocladium strictum]|uniref:Uncharacterized protein n=1 Tax=Sarocladium strictum TaxID=5046 RepID=A0AA39GFF6_SARSR|nr:hypothetical protein NLU13_6747 [Sarocladium strictum]
MIFLQDNQRPVEPYIRDLDKAKTVQNGVEKSLGQIATETYCLTFEDIRCILRAGLNPRSCADLDAAKALLQSGTHYKNEKGEQKQSLPDFISVMGGFSSVVGSVVKSQSPHSIEGKPGVHVELELTLSAYVDNRNPDDVPRLWGEVGKVLDSFTVEQRKLICEKVTKELVAGMKKVSQGPRTYLVMAPAQTMMSTDKDGYGGFGKTGGLSMKRDEADFDRSVIIDSSGQSSEVACVPARLVWAFAEHAERLAHFHESRPLYGHVLSG